MSQRNTTYSSDSPNQSKVEYVYDPKKGTWVPTSTTSPSLGETPTPKPTNTNSVPASTTGNESSSSVDSQTNADKEYIETEFNTLVGDVALTPSKKSIRIGVNNTVDIQGIGSYLSGRYFVSGVRRTLSRDSGYSQTISVLKNGFGGSLKKSADTRNTTVDKSPASFNVGDSVKIVGDAIYSNAHEGVKVPEWVKQQTLTVRQLSDDGNRALLMPIFSWTYIRYLKKA